MGFAHSVPAAPGITPPGAAELYVRPRNQKLVALSRLRHEAHHITKAEPMKLLAPLLSFPIALALAGCGALAEVAYDDAVYRERAQCEKLVSAQERQSCLQRVNTAKRQADEMRRK
jgi:hypothetical protein